MPTYEYLCDDCGNQQDEKHLMSEDPEIECSECGAMMSKNITGGMGFTFYRTAVQRARDRVLGVDPPKGRTQGVEDEGDDE